MARRCFRNNGGPLARPPVARVPGIRPNISESHSEISSPYCVAPGARGTRGDNPRRDHNGHRVRMPRVAGPRRGLYTRGEITTIILLERHLAREGLVTRGPRERKESSLARGPRRGGRVTRRPSTRGDHPLDRPRAQPATARAGWTERATPRSPRRSGSTKYLKPPPSVRPILIIETLKH